MKNQDLLVNLYRTFAQFVPKDVLGKSFVTSDRTSLPGANEFFTELMNSPNNNIVPEIDAFVVSSNESVVSDRVKNSKDITLFVEYGDAQFNPVVSNGYTQQIAFTVAKDYSSSNIDNLNEILHGDICLNIMTKILTKLKEDSDTQCSVCGKWIFPADIIPIEPKNFYGRSGFACYINLSNTYIS